MCLVIKDYGVVIKECDVL